MLLKLLKYDFKSMLRSFVPLWIAFIAVSIINRFTARIPEMGNLEGFSSLVTRTSLFLYTILMIGINVVGLVLVIQRFYNGLLKDEGYLMFTLPVKPYQHVLSKGIASTAVITLNALISVGSVIILAGPSAFMDWMRMIAENISEINMNPNLLISLVMLLAFVSIIANVYRIYASMTLGHLFNNHRVAFSVGAYLAISVAMSMLGSISVTIFSHTSGLNWLINAVTAFFSAGESTNAFWAMYGTSIGVTLLQLAAFYITTERILAKKLNLE
jgi:hypothetical protein